MTTALNPAPVDRLGDAPDHNIDPVIRWAGGKRWLVATVRQLVASTDVKRYFEPFLGGASIFLGMPTFANAYLGDLNSELIETYAQIRDNWGGVADALSRYQNSEAEYYAARNDSPADPLGRAARFIYLNHTSYNGIYRVNLQGKYNVPYGYRKSIKMPDRHHLEKVAHKLSNAALQVGDFAALTKLVEENDFVFFDPPYTVAHNNNGFIKYNQHLFSFEDQERLASEISRITARGAKFVLTNAAHASIDELFSPLGRRLVVRRRNAVGGRSAVRGSADEYLFTNIGVD